MAQIACGVFHTMFLLQSSEVFAVGRGDWGLLGMGDRMDRKLPSKITELQVLSFIPNHQPLNISRRSYRITELLSSRAASATGCVNTGRMLLPL